MAEETAQRSRQGSGATNSADFILDVESLEGSHILESSSNPIENESDSKAKSEIGEDNSDEKEEEKATEVYKYYFREPHPTLDRGKPYALFRSNTYDFVGVKYVLDIPS
ncbi:hypothetical protein BGZ81_003002 [Podila clonocystis]|nr:hypothetical protein BGZ81_003002 [Podila clonocystis]